MGSVAGMDTSPAFARAAAVTLGRDALWRDPPPLAADCGHAFRCLPVVEFRQTVVCARCGGLNVGLSRELAACPAAFTVDDDRYVTRRAGGV